MACSGMRMKEATHVTHMKNIYKNIMKISEIMNICFRAVSQLPFHEVDFSKLSKPNDILMIKNQSDSEGIQVQHVQQCLATHHRHCQVFYHFTGDCTVSKHITSLGSMARGPPCQVHKRLLQLLLKSVRKLANETTFGGLEAMEYHFTTFMHRPMLGRKTVSRW